MNLLKSSEVAKALGVTRAYVCNLCKDGKLKGVLVTSEGGKKTWFVPQEDLQEFIETRSVYGPRSPVRKLLARIMADGQPHKIKDLYEYVQCSPQLVRNYLKDMGCHRVSWGVWVKQQGQ